MARSRSRKSAAYWTAKAFAPRAASASFCESKDCMDQKLKNNVAVVTGAARGIGLAIAERLARDGAKLVIADMDEAQLDKPTPHLPKALPPPLISHPRH